MRKALKRFFAKVLDWLDNQTDRAKLSIYGDRMDELLDELEHSENPVRRKEIVILSGMFSDTYKKIQDRINTRREKHKRLQRATA